jgi:hypothetical protein
MFFENITFHNYTNVIREITIEFNSKTSMFPFHLLLLMYLALWSNSHIRFYFISVGKNQLPVTHVKIRKGKKEERISRPAKQEMCLRLEAFIYVLQ